MNSIFLHLLMALCVCMLTEAICRKGLYEILLQCEVVLPGLMDRKPQSLTLLLALGLLGGCHFFQAAQPPQAAPPPSVSTTTLRLEKVAEYYEYLASLDSRFYVELKPRVTGYISRILVESGQKVPQGELLFVIDPRVQEQALYSQTESIKSAHSDLIDAQATLNSFQAQKDAAESNLSLAESQLKRYQKLFQEQLISRTAYDQYTNNLERAKSDLDSIKAQIESQRAKVKSAEGDLGQSKAAGRGAQAELDFYRIRAPFAGTVGDLPVKLGDYVGPETTLTTVANTDRLELEVALPVETASQLALHDRVQILDQTDRLVGEAKIFYIASSVKADTQTVLVKASYANDTHKLRANQQIKLRVSLHMRDGLRVPISAVSRLGDSAYVFQMFKKGEEFFVRQVPLRLGELQESHYIVESGLEPGQIIVIGGIEKLRDRAQVKPKYDQADEKP